MSSNSKTDMFPFLLSHNIILQINYTGHRLKCNKSFYWVHENQPYKNYSAKTNIQLNEQSTTAIKNNALRNTIELTIGYHSLLKTIHKYLVETKIISRIFLLFSWLPMFRQLQAQLTHHILPINR